MCRNPSHEQKGRTLTKNVSRFVQRKCNSDVSSHFRQKTVWVGHSCPTRIIISRVGRTFLSDKDQHISCRSCPEPAEGSGTHNRLWGDGRPRPSQPITLDLTRGCPVLPASFAGGRGL